MRRPRARRASAASSTRTSSPPAIPQFAYPGPEDEWDSICLLYTSRHHRQPQGRRLQPSRRLPRRARQRAHLQARPREPLPVDAADVPLLGLDLHLGGDGGRRHARVPAQGRAQAHLRCHRRAPRSRTCAARRSCSTCWCTRRPTPSGRCRCAPRWRPAAPRRRRSSSSAWRPWASRCCTSTAPPRATGPSTYCAPMAEWQALPTSERYARMARQGIPNPRHRAT